MNPYDLCPWCGNLRYTEERCAECGDHGQQSDPLDYGDDDWRDDIEDPWVWW